MPPQAVSVATLFNFGVQYLVIALAAVFAWRNFRGGRGDLAGAGRLAAFIFSVEMLEWLCTAHHLTGPGLGLFLLGIMWAGLIAALIWTLYVALEPYVRRRWPQSIVSWSRLLSGGIRDPLIGGHLLIGIGMGVGVACLYLVRVLLSAHYGSLDFRIRCWIRDACWACSSADRFSVPESRWECFWRFF
jgi:hypothetical protein